MVGWSSCLKGHLTKGNLNFIIKFWRSMEAPLLAQIGTKFQNCHYLICSRKPQTILALRKMNFSYRRPLIFKFWKCARRGTTNVQRSGILKASTTTMKRVWNLFHLSQNYKKTEQETLRESQTLNYIPKPVKPWHIFILQIRKVIKCEETDRRKKTSIPS